MAGRRLDQENSREKRQPRREPLLLHEKRQFTSGLRYHYARYNVSGHRRQKMMREAEHGNNVDFDDLADSAPG